MLAVNAEKRLQAAPDDGSGQHRGDDLERLDLLLGVVPAGAVLHHEHARDPAAGGDRHAEEGVVDLLAGLRQVGEGGMRLGVRQVERPRLSGDQADETLAELERRLVHGGRVEALGGIELQHLVGAQHIDRADLRHHVGGDHHHDLVEAFLRAHRLRHHFAKPA